MTRRLLFFFVAVTVLCSCMAVTVHATESNISSWIELLETATVNDSGRNLYTLAATSGTFRIKTPQYMRCTKVDMILAHPSGSTPTSVKVRYNNIYYTLTMQKIDDYTTRVYGANIPDTLYADLVFQINKSGKSSVAYQILSCRVTSLSNAQYKATAFAEVAGTKHNAPFSIDITDDSVADAWAHFQFPVVVSDWQKYDKIVISGSVGQMALNSVRATVKGLGLPYEISYAVCNSSGADINAYTWNEMKYYTYDESYKGKSETNSYIYSEYRGKTLFTISIDLTGVDRTITDELYCFFTCLANPRFGYTVQIMEVMGFVDIADTENLSWWAKLTAFFTDLLGGDTAVADEFQEDAAQKGDEMDDLNNQLQEVTKPPVDDLDLELNIVDDVDMGLITEQFTKLTNHSMILTMLLTSLTVALLAYILYGKR